MMSTDEREKRWMAYLDGQMSTSEALEFERSLSPRDKERMAGEVRLESAICESLMGRECCPVALWASLADRMRMPVTSAKPPMSRGVYWTSRALTVLAATALVVFGVTLYGNFFGEVNQADASIIGIQEKTVEEFANGAEVPATLAAAQQFLKDNQIDLELVHSGIGDGHHPVKYLGACASKCKDKTLLELRFSCCGKPAKLLVARRGTPGATKILNGKRCGDVQEIVERGDYVTAVICGHNAPDIINLLQPSRANLI